MIYYFKLQYQRYSRYLSQNGINPYLGTFCIIIAFFLFGKFLFYKTNFANYIMLILTFILVVKNGEKSRVDFLKSIFSKNDYFLARVIENTITVLLPIMYLVYEGCLLESLILLFLAFSLSFININNSYSFTLPTPFWKFPFEFIVGFRKSILVICFSYFLLIKAIQVDNFNLGLFALGLNYFLGMAFYSSPEKVFFVWINSKISHSFLVSKISTALICVLILSLPILLILLLSYPENWVATISVHFIGSLYLIAMVLAKYSAYPNSINLPQAILLGMGFWFPPILVITIPIFYRKAKAQLKPILE